MIEVINWEEQGEIGKVRRSFLVSKTSFVGRDGIHMSNQSKKAHTKKLLNSIRSRLFTPPTAAVHVDISENPIFD